MLQLLTQLLPAIYSLSILVVLLIVITDNRNPLKTLPWILVLVLAPGAGLAIYFFFGQNLSKRRIISRRTRKRITTRLEENDAAGGTGIPPQRLPLARLLSQTALAVPLYGSRLTPYVDGKTKMDALLEAIAGARHHIHIQYYIFSDDETGRRLRDALTAKAREGVEVRILYDDVGCTGVKKAFFEGMRADGIEAYSFLHVKFPRFTSKVNYRNHRKIVVIDGRTGFLGGMNIADRYLYGNALGPWRDTHFRLEGGGVAGLQASFLNDWYATTRCRITDERYYPPFETDEPNTLQIVSSGPLGKWRTLQQATCLAVGRARRRIWIETPYYLPSEPLNNALQTAALAGIDVRLLLPLHSDSKVVDLAVHSYLDDMMRAGVKVCFYTAGFLHAKLLIVDDDLAVIGSANMDFRSFEHNFEVSAFVYDAALVDRLAHLFERDLAQSRRPQPAEWFRRSKLRRFAESLLRLFSPLL